MCCLHLFFSHLLQLQQKGDSEEATGSGRFSGIPSRLVVDSSQVDSLSSSAAALIGATSVYSAADTQNNADLPRVLKSSKALPIPLVGVLNF